MTNPARSARKLIGGALMTVGFVGAFVVIIGAILLADPQTTSPFVATFFGFGVLGLIGLAIHPKIWSSLCGD